MRYLFAPLEGITGFLYRNAYHHFFHQMDGYYTPFLAPNKHHHFTSRELQDIIPEHNQGLYLVPQILTNQAEDFLWAAKELEQWGYSEVNLNLGCPSATVVRKGKGAGMLEDLAFLEHFLETVFAACPIAISVKTRLGMQQPGEVAELLDVLEPFPVKEWILHPRVQKDFYNNKPNWEAFRVVLHNSRHTICYNGDLFTAEDYHRFCDAFPEIKSVMFGRGVLKNPNLLGEICDGKILEKATLQAFHDTLLEGYQRAFSGDVPVLFKMKELWSYMLPLFEGGDTFEKSLRKVQKISVYRGIVMQIFECPLAVYP